MEYQRDTSSLRVPCSKPGFSKGRRNSKINNSTRSSSIVIVTIVKLGLHCTLEGRAAPRPPLRQAGGNAGRVGIQGLAPEKTSNAKGSKSSNNVRIPKPAGSPATRHSSATSPQAPHPIESSSKLSFQNVAFATGLVPPFASGVGALPGGLRWLRDPIAGCHV